MAHHEAGQPPVDAAYGYKGAATDAARVAFLFGLLPAAHQPAAGREHQTQACAPYRQRRLLSFTALVI
jgi:hypothetical protein